MAYDSLEPIGQQRDDVRTALLCATVANLAQAVWGKKDAPKSTLNDFLLVWDAKGHKENKKPQTVEEMKAVLHLIAKRPIRKKT